MKKFLAIFVLLFLVSASFAHMSEEQSARVNAAARMASKGQTFLALARQGKVAEFRKELVNAPYYSLQEVDTHGNNILHLASSKEMFSFLWNLLDEHTRETLLSQRNKAGETPMTAHVMYNHEDIFLQYFPQTDLYQQLKRTTMALQGAGLNRHVAEIKKEELIKQCSMGNQTMWQLAHALYQDTYTQHYLAKHRESMRAVQNMIADAAPFLVVRG
ncbi:MAG: hypothetical protein IKN49_01995 [Elusimicrobiaceae bacterium]|nr:hypothetical protein [Elusimicrobiaceae bacterium]